MEESVLEREGGIAVLTAVNWYLIRTGLGLKQ